MFLNKNFTAVVLLTISLFCCLASFAQTNAANPVRLSGKYRVELLLPKDGLHPGENTFAVSVSVSMGDGQATLPALAARISPALTMPAMASMSIEAPTVSAGEKPGETKLTAKFPHSGAYQLDLNIAPGDGKPFRVSFPLTAAGEMGKMSGMNSKNGGMSGMEMDGMSRMMAPFAGVGMMQQASGTSWEPAVAPMYGVMRQSGRWNTMTHYNAFFSYDRQGGKRGDYQYNSTNWAMFMAEKPVGQDKIMLRAMLTLEPLTVTPGGFPLLLQSGEQYDGKPLVDRQHPHDFFIEVAAKYTHPLGKDSAVFLYAAPAGEPALGPTAFMHRTSAMDNPAAPISHHWQDSTHIEFGVLTLGAWKRNVQVEGSYFTGREPNETRWDLSPFHPDSFSGRISYNPSPNWSLQASYGYLHSPELLRPNEDTRRSTASASYILPRRDGGFWANSLIFGRNSAGGINSDAYLLESELNIANRNSFFTRLEYVEKRGEELDIAPADHKFGITQWTLGYVHDVTPRNPFETGLGASVTFSAIPSDLKPLYGDNPTSFWLFVRIRPAPMR